MSRIATGDTIVVRPTNNVYTALVVAATLAQIIALVAIWVRNSELFPGTGIF